MAESSPSWKVLQFIGLPKETAVTEFKGLRWICKSAVLQNLYLRSLRLGLRRQVRLSAVHSYGFRKCASAAQLTGLVRELLYSSAKWNLPLVVAGQDISVAFDSMPHESIWISMLSRGVTSLTAGLHLRELTALEAYITLPFVGKTKLFSFNTGGKQGGVETPDEWRILIDYVLEPLVCKWNCNGNSFKWLNDDGDETVFVNHAVATPWKCRT